MRRSTASAGFWGQEAGKRVGRKGRNRRRAAVGSLSSAEKLLEKRSAGGRERREDSGSGKEGGSEGCGTSAENHRERKAGENRRASCRKAGQKCGKEKSDRESPKIRTLHFLYTASTFLVLTILVIGVTMINNYDQMKKMEQTMARDDGRGHGVWKSGGDRKNGL